VGATRSAPERIPTSTEGPHPPHEPEPTGTSRAAFVLTRARCFALLLLAVAGALLFGAASPAGASTPPPVTCDGPAIQVRLNDQATVDGENVDTPLPDVTVTVADAAGAPVGEAVTNDRGIAKICVPARADYAVTIDTDTLPDDKELSGESTILVSGDRFVTSTFNLAFHTGERAATGRNFFEKLAQNSLNGARLGLVIAMASVGLSLIFGTTGLTNFAHGEMVTFGALMAFYFNSTLDMTIWVAAPISIALGGAFGLLFDAVLFGPLRRHGIGLVSQLVVSVGLSLLLRNVFLFQFGGRTKPLPAFNGQIAKDWGPFTITLRDLTTTIISIIVLIAVALALQRTRFGKATRAVSDNPDLASSTGINSQQVIRIVWFVGGSLAAMGGLFRALSTDGGVSPETGSSLIFVMFAGITLGGLGSAYGALVGGFIVGLFIELSTQFGVPTELKNVPPLVVLVLILLVRPQGILGRRERVG
jgi:neutral amino acid transport system permease protein